MTQKTRSFRSPLKAAPLHNPGQSLDYELRDLLTDKVMPWLIIAFSFTVWGVVDLLRWYSDIPVYPQAAVALLLFSWIGFGWVYWRSLKKADQIKLNRDGERAVGQYLDRLRESGAQIYHDIPSDDVRGGKVNLDHVIIAPQGIFVVETKTLHKPAKGKAEISVRQGAIYVNGQVLDDNPIERSIALADWLCNLLEEQTKKRFPVRPAVVFPGWYVHRVRRDAGKGAWVLNPKGLPAFIASEPQSLSPEDVKNASLALSRYIRSQV